LPFTVVEKDREVSADALNVEALCPLSLRERLG
jgi:hypothetical protein